MILDPHGFVHVAEDGIARSYGGEQIHLCPTHIVLLLTYCSQPTAPSSTTLLSPMPNLSKWSTTSSLPPRLTKKHLAEVFAVADGFSVKDEHQIFHPSTQLRPAVDPTQTHWREEIGVDLPDEAEISLERYVECSQEPCRTGLECLDSGCDVCIIYDMVAARFCRSSEF